MITKKGASVNPKASLSNQVKTMISKLSVLLLVLAAVTNTHAFTIFTGTFYSHLRERYGSSEQLTNDRKAIILNAKSKCEEPVSTTTIQKSEDYEAESSAEFDTILQSRRTINNFEADLPENWEDAFHQAILSAIHAPNHKRTEPWRFHLLGPKTIRKVCELNASIVTEKKGEKAGQKKLERWLQMPGWVVVTCQTENGCGSMDKPSGIDREDYAACCCAVQNLCLSLHNAGLGTKWTTGPVNFDSRFTKIVGLDEGEYVVGTIWFGVPESPPVAPTKKNGVEDVIIKHD